MLIPEEIASRIFEPFFTTQKHSGGLRIGLAIARRIAVLFHGTVDLIQTKQVKIFQLRLRAYEEVGG